MKAIQGKYSTAIVYASIIDEETMRQIQELTNQKFTKDLKIRIMADCHAGAGCVIGTTMDIHDCVVPSLVGVDIGCGMLTVKLKQMDIDLIRLDRFVRKKIPSGMEVYNDEVDCLVDITKLKCYDSLDNKKRIMRSMGTLGGGNHFIEVDKDDENNLYLIIHTGSRNLGKQIAQYYIEKANADYKEKVKKKMKDLVLRYKKLGKEDKIQEGLLRLKNKYEKIHPELVPLYKNSFKDYMHDMAIAQEFAKENREVIARKILNYLQLNLDDFEFFHTTHNYINMEDMILRKGSIAAYENQEILIPINMRDGSILAKGKSNAQYNFSAPHGAGRLMSRKEARETISIEQFKQCMEGIYSTSVQVDTLDESPFAYKSLEDILPNIQDSVEVIKILHPIYNFKACKRSR